MGHRKNNLRKLLGVAPALAMLLLGTVAEAATPAPRPFAAESELRELVEKFSAMGSRAPGYPGNDQAADFIAAYFASLEIGEVYMQPFECAVPVEKFGTLELQSGSKSQIHPMLPNRVRTPTVPPEGIQGNLVYAGEGLLEGLDGVPLDGSIALMDYDSGTKWLTLANLGVSAFIFLPPPQDKFPHDGPTVKTLSVPINIPRFYIQSGAEELKAEAISAGKPGIRATLKARMDWEKARTRNVFLRIPGREPSLASDYIVICAPYDSLSIAPAVAPGAEQSASIASLLLAAKAFKENPPERSVVLVATSAHCFALAGARRFIEDYVTYKGLVDGTVKRDESNASVWKLYSSLFPDIKRSFFLCLEVTSHNDAFGMFVLGTFFGRGTEEPDWPRLKTAYDPFSETVEKRARLIEQQLGLEKKVFVNGVKTERSVDYGIYFFNGAASDMEVIRSTTGNKKYFNAGAFFQTTQDARPAYWSPRDLPNLMNFASLSSQLRVLIPLLQDFTAGSDIPIDVSANPDQALIDVHGRVVWFDPRTSFVPDTPLEGAVVMHHPFFRAISGAGEASYGTMAGGVLLTAFDIADADGRFRFENFAKTTTSLEMGFQTIEAYALDKETGEIIYAPDRGVNGEERYPALQFSLSGTDVSRQVTAVLFRCSSTGLLGLIDPRYMDQLVGLTVLDGEMKTTPNVYGYALPLNWPGSTSSGGDAAAVAFTTPGTRISLLMGLGLIGNRLVLIDSSKANPDGAGYDPPRSGVLRATELLTAQDMWNRDDWLMARLARFGIRSEDTVQLHQRAGELIETARRAMSANHDEFLADSKRAWAYETQAYANTRKIGDDTVRSVIFYMALLLPFSLFTERLLFGFTDIRMRIAGWVGIFLLVFLIFWAVHPAFRITITPYIIFLAFVLLALSLLVVVMAVSRFRAEIRKLRIQLVGIPEADVSRTAALMTAFALGVSHMRRRKVRTTLTCVTLILITFSILSFTSVREHLRTTKVPQPWAAPYNGFLLRDVAWQALNLESLERVKLEFAAGFPVAPRAWWVKTAQAGVGSEIVPVVHRLDRQGPKCEASGALGLTPEEAQVTGADKALLPGRSRWFKGGERGVCILPTSLARPLEITDEDLGAATIEVASTVFRVIGLVDEQKFDALKDLDDQPVTPVDYGALSSLDTSMMMGTEDQTGQTRVADYFHVSISGLLILPFEDALGMPGSGAGSSSGSLRSVAVAFGSNPQGYSRTEEFIRQTALTGVMGKEGKSYVISSIGATSVSGLRGLMVTMLLGVLIVFNTMLGSVYERLDEIEIFNSAGLAPNHIAMLFLAEAAVFGVIGSVVGYLLGQTAAKIMMTLGFLQGLSLNYSSTSVVMTMLLVMGVVMASAIYPARMAANLAVPDIQRRWRLPPPKGDAWEFSFPFTIHLKEALGLNFFLTTYLEGMSGRDVGGTFTVKNLTFAETKPSHFVLAADCWLAPYDLGVSQHVELHTLPSEEMAEYMQLVLRAKRLSGEIGAWMRTNRPFLNDFRKQFLLWKTISRADRERFAQMGARRAAASEAQT